MVVWKLHLDVSIILVSLVAGLTTNQIHCSVEQISSQWNVCTEWRGVESRGFPPWSPAQISQWRSSAILPLFSETHYVNCTPAPRLWRVCVCVCVCVVSANHVIYQWMQNSSWKRERERERENKNQSNQSNQICDILKWEIQGCGKQAIMALFAADRWICKWNGQEAARLHIASDGLFWVMGLPGRWLNQCDFAISSQGFAIAVDLSEILGHVEHQEKHQFLSVVFSSSFGFHRTRWQFSRLALEMISEEMESNRYRRWFHRWISTGNYEKFSRLIWSIILI